MAPLHLTLSLHLSIALPVLRQPAAVALMPFLLDTLKVLHFVTLCHFVACVNHSSIHTCEGGDAAAECDCI